MEGFTVWIAGPGGEEKSALARELEGLLLERGLRVERLDEGEVRAHLSRELAGLPEGEGIHARRLAWVAGLLTRNGVAAIVAAAAGDRDLARTLGPRFLEVECRPGESAASVLAALEGRGLVEPAADAGYSEEEEREITGRLEDLGYL